MIYKILAIAFVGNFVLQKIGNSIGNNIKVELSNAKLVDLASFTFGFTIKITNTNPAPLYFSSLAGNVEYQNIAIGTFSVTEPLYIEPNTTQELNVSFSPNLSSLVAAITQGISLGIRVNYTIMFGDLPYTSHNDISVGITVQ
ncbi:MAG: LEA type 2 family protein [Chitinophagales bacterium]